MTSKIEKGKFGTTILKLYGDISAYQTDSFKRTLSRLAHMEDGPKNIIIDLHDVGVIDPLALGVLTSMARIVREDGGDIRFANMCPGIRRLFDQTRLALTYEIYGNVGEAAKSYRYLR